MATETIYNPLIKKGFQELNDVSSIQAAIDALQENVNTLQHALNALKSNKITKVTQAAELSEIEVNEIFEWQADNATIDGVSFVKGYFYQASSATGSVTPPVDMLQFSNAFPLNAEYVLGDYNFTFGNYYKIQAYANNVSTITIYDYTDTNSVYRYHCLAPINVNDAVGKIVFDRQLNTFETITEVDAVNYIATTDNGQYINISGVSYGGFTALWQCGNADGTEKFNILIPSSGMYYLLVHYDFANNVIIDWFPFQCIKTTSGSSYTYNTVGFAQTDTQPQQLSVVDNQVKYTLSDNITQINLVSDDTISDTAVNFTAAAVSGNIASGETLGTMAKKISNALQSQHNSGVSFNADFVHIGAVYINTYPTFKCLVVFGEMILKAGTFAAGTNCIKFSIMNFSVGQRPMFLFSNGLDFLVLKPKSSAADNQWFVTARSYTFENTQSVYGLPTIFCSY